ncbi:MAG: Fic family protein [Micrococcales bacterium]|nr:Fic family protein [Micrococcales bacterium]MCL2668841.1 Fic family protein [Micrococcales bacterium]
MDERLFPRHTSETLPWEPRHRAVRRVTSYEASVPPFIAQVEVSPSASASEAARQAAVDIALLEHEAGGHLASLEPFLARTEAIASSRIEEQLTTVDQLARAEAGIGAPRGARTVKAAIDGLHLLVERSQDGVTLDTLLAAHAPLLADDPAERHYAGRLRDVQNWIGGSDHAPVGAVHVPPHPDRVPALMDDLMTFANRGDLDPVVQAAVVHGQFESVHPFTDGNGRVGRSLINAVWRARGVTRTIAVPIASALVTDRDRYFQLVNDYRDGVVDPLVEHIAASASRAAQEARVSAHWLADLPVHWDERVHPRRGSVAHALIHEHLLAHPVLDAYDIRRLTGASSAAVYDAVSRLVAAGVLRPITQSRRDVTWAAGEVLDEADALQDRLRHPLS